MKTTITSLLSTPAFFAAWLAIFSTPSLSIEKEVAHSYQSCTIITTELLTTVQFYERDIPLDQLLESLPDLSQKGMNRVRSTYRLIKQSGLLSAYSAINSDYAKCAKQVFANQGKPQLATTDYGYYYCSGENKLRYEIALAIYLKADQQEVVPQLPPNRQQIGKHYYALADENGLAAVFELMANSLKHCVNQIPTPTL